MRFKEHTFGEYMARHSDNVKCELWKIHWKKFRRDLFRFIKKSVESSFSWRDKRVYLQKLILKSIAARFLAI